jgi:CheY-like chemotaxis protein
MLKKGKLSIMVIEDEELLLDVIKDKMAETDLDIISCKSGEEAIQLLENSKTHPSAIWLDYHLKGMDGLQFISHIKLNPELATIPIIVVSNSADDETVQRLLDAGANKYLLKAQNRMDDILNVIRGMFRQNGGR